MYVLFLKKKPVMNTINFILLPRTLWKYLTFDYQNMIEKRGI